MMSDYNRRTIERHGQVLLDEGEIRAMSSSAREGENRFVAAPCAIWINR
jgi:hypothetical protein